VKDLVVDLVNVIAESWATTTGWTPHAGTGPVASEGLRSR
jgi:hypothetical protein